MKTRVLLLAALLAAFSLTGFLESPFMRYVYSIEDGSRLTIEGSSNVNSFACLGSNDLSPMTISVLPVGAGDTLRFNNAILTLRTKSLDCDNSQMNKDLCEAMKADEYPYIKIEIHGAMLQSGNLREAGSDWATMKAVATLTIVNVSKRVVLDVKAKRLSPDRFRFVAAKDMRMTDFNITPPSVMLGLIKVNNAIRISFDLTTKAKPE